MQVSDYMSKSPVTVQSSVNYADAFTIMKDHNMHHLPVVDGADEVVGIVTQRDLQLAARVYREAPVELGEIMHKPVVSIKPDSTLADAANEMMTRHIGCLPVVEDGKHVMGMLTETDLFRALAEMLQQRG